MSPKKERPVLGDVGGLGDIDISSLKRPAVAPVSTPAPAETLKEQLRPVAADFVSTRTTMPAQKMVKDAFSMPSEDYAMIQQAMDRALFHRRRLSKVGTVRAALRALSALDDNAFLTLIDSVPELKPGPRR